MSELMTSLMTFEPLANYITTDPDSQFPLVAGKRYFMDFDISDIPHEVKILTPLEANKYKFIDEMRALGHDPGRVEVSIPATDMIRITFTANPLPVAIVIAIAVFVIMLGAGISGGIFVGFVGLGEAVAGLSDIPEKLTTAAMKNPWAVIAIVIAVGLFLLGVKL